MDLSMKQNAYYEQSLEVEVYPHLKAALGLIDPLLPKIAVDAGCGAGRDVLFLVGQGFTVYAFDKNEAAIERLREQNRAGFCDRLIVQVDSFEAFEYPKAALISACSSLFFCHPQLFPRAWENISHSLMPGGIFCGHFMGPGDSWAKMDRGDLTIHTRDELNGLFGNYEVIDIYEHNAEGVTLLGRKKHWHTYSVVARKII